MITELFIVITHCTCTPHMGHGGISQSIVRPQLHLPMLSLAANEYVYY